ncbi:MAG: hypothetical protein ABIF40_00490 [archaeon]
MSFLSRLYRPKGKDEERIKVDGELSLLMANVWSIGAVACSGLSVVFSYVEAYNSAVGFGVAVLPLALCAYNANCSYKNSELFHKEGLEKKLVKAERLLKKFDNEVPK